MLNESYRELFTAVATCSAGLVGLLFVAISVTPSAGRRARPTIIQEVRAASALIAFTNALAVSMFGLVPGGSVGDAALVVGVIGLAFTAASVRSIVASPDVSKAMAWRQAGLILLLLGAFSGEVCAGIGLITSHTGLFGPDVLSNILIALLLIGIARAWELVGNRDTGILSSLSVLTGVRLNPGDADEEDHAEVKEGPEPD